jgi:hypothetical protein
MRQYVPIQCAAYRVLAIDILRFQVPVQDLPELHLALPLYIDAARRALTGAQWVNRPTAQSRRRSLVLLLASAAWKRTAHLSVADNPTFVRSLPARFLSRKRSPSFQTLIRRLVECVLVELGGDGGGGGGALPTINVFGLTPRPLRLLGL